MLEGMQTFKAQRILQNCNQDFSIDDDNANFQESLFRKSECILKLVSVNCFEFVLGELLKGSL